MKATNPHATEAELPESDRAGGRLEIVGTEIVNVGWESLPMGSDKTSGECSVLKMDGTLCEFGVTRDCVMDDKSLSVWKVSGNPTSSVNEESYAVNSLIVESFAV